MSFTLSLLWTWNRSLGGSHECGNMINSRKCRRGILETRDSCDIIKHLNARNLTATGESVCSCHHSRSHRDRITAAMEVTTSSQRESSQQHEISITTSYKARAMHSPRLRLPSHLRKCWSPKILSGALSPGNQKKPCHKRNF